MIERDHIDHLDQPRRLGLLPPTANCQRLRAAARSLSAITDILPRSQWVETHYKDAIPKADWAKLVLDQAQYGRCVAGSCMGANAVTRYLRTGKIVIGSMSWMYSQICGGGDNGAVITSAQQVMLSTGVPTVDQAPDEPQRFNPQPMPAGSVVLKEDEAIAIDTPDEIATALIKLGGFTQGGINVTRSFESFTSAGVAWGGRLPPPGANHSIYIIDIVHVGGQWYFKLVNDWNNTSWGPYGDGTCLIPIDSVDAGGWLHLSQFDSDDEAPRPVS